MSVTIIELPSKFIALDNTPTVGFTSKWLAVHQPIVYKMQRKDVNVNNIINDGSGHPKATLSAPVTRMVAGQTVYINSGLYVKNYTILTVVSTTIIILNATFVGNSVGGYCNLISLRPNYYVETTVYFINYLNQLVEAGKSINKPALDGTIKTDVSSFLKSAIDYNDKFQYNVLNQKDYTQGGKGNIKYQEFWTGSSTIASAIIPPNTIYFVNSAKQIQQKYGSNFGEYVPCKDPVAGPVPKARFMSSFKAPTYFPGFPFSLSFIYSDNIHALELSKFEQSIGINNNTILEIDTVLDTSQSLAVNRLMLTGNYPTNVKELNVWLECGSKYCDQYIHNDYVVDGYVQEVCTIVDPLPIPID